MAQAGFTLAVSVMSTCARVLDEEDDADVKGGCDEEVEFDGYVAICDCVLDEDEGDRWLVEVDSHLALGASWAWHRTCLEDEGPNDELATVDARRRAAEDLTIRDALHVDAEG